MLNAKQAQAMVKEYYDTKDQKSQETAKTWVEEVVSAQIEVAASSGLHSVSVTNTLDARTQSYAVAILADLGYRVSSALGIVNINW